MTSCEVQGAIGRGSTSQYNSNALSTTMGSSETLEWERGSLSPRFSGSGSIRSRRGEAEQCSMQLNAAQCYMQLKKVCTVHMQW